MTLLARLGERLPERNYLGIDVGYTILAQGKEHVGVVITLQSFARDGERWKRAPCLHFPSTRSGLEKLQEYLDGFSIDREAFFGICEPTGGFYGASMFQYLLDEGYPMWLIENATTRHMREKIMGSIPTRAGYRQDRRH